MLRASLGVLSAIAFMNAASALPPTDSLVAPAGYENAPAPSNNSIPFSWSSTRYQQIYGAADLQEAVGQLITSVAFRVAEDDGFDGDFAGGFVYADFSIDVSETPVAVENIGLDLDANHGPNRTTVFSGNYVVPALEGDLLVNPFDLRFVFQTPFLYSGGNLLVDFKRAKAEAPLPNLDAVVALDTVKRAYNDTLGIGAPRSDDTLGLITQFEFRDVPEPAAGLMLPSLGVMFWGLFRRLRAGQK
ncbi:hypothetical protein [Lacipirellula parvula]|uniref:PEP-CTERM protein-sorting domain-containing protein n=1 Tax=Lacipirellula parvula TaxID=2650471 RepID=A0A5K7X7Z9_9BACT|nr:hypothetical protein [Lacipirellula parvula]BBO31992.1 hypothetical protein PLANPX_1604 [Lacipirellula parvula]